MITNILIIVCVAIFVLINFIDKGNDKYTQAIKYGALYPPRVSIKKEYWRIFTANFVHVDFLHIFMNMYAIYYLGDFFEFILGSFAYVYLLLMSGIATSLLTYVVSLKNPRLENTITLGASGLFYGFLGAMIVMGVVLQGPFLQLLKSYLYIIVINVGFTLFNPHVSKTGHLGGLLGGALAMLVLIGTGICAY